MTRFTLVLEKGRLATREFELKTDSITLGNASLNDICLPDDPSVARVHAEIRRGAAGLIAVAPVGQEVTAVNGKPITASTPLKLGDRIAIGRYQFRVSDGAASAPAAEPAAAAASKGASPIGATLPTWVIGYLIGMVGVFGFLLFNRANNVESLETVSAQERQFATAQNLPQDTTDRVLRLLTLAQVYERQGKLQIAYEVYRDLLGARSPAQPQSPAYRFAATRMAAVGGLQ